MSALPPDSFDVFISYCSHDSHRVLAIASRLQEAGVSVWLDRTGIAGGREWAAEIVRAIDACKVVILMCSNASMRSVWVKREIQVAGQQAKPFLPLMLERTSYPDQVRLFLTGYQWVDVLDRPPKKWLQQVLRALSLASVTIKLPAVPSTETSGDIKPTALEWDLEGLRRLASFTDQIWPVAAHKINRERDASTTRGLGAPQSSVQHGFRLGDRICLIIENDRPGHLLLLDEGPEGTLYCLCPSHFAPSTRYPKGRTYVPQDRSHYDAFVLTGKTGREKLLAIISDEPLNLDWMPADLKIPARVLNASDIKQLLGILRELPGTRWTALSTYFDVLG